MRYFFIGLAVGICLIAFLLFVFFKAGRKTGKQKRADRELVQNYGDESLILLYEQAESDNERDGIVEFVREKLCAPDTGLATPADIMPAGSLATAEMSPPEEQPAEWPIEQASEQPEAEMRSEMIPEVTEEMMADAPADLAPEGRRQITGLVTDAAEAMDRKAEQSKMLRGDTHLETRALPLDKMDWAILEEALQKKREEEARMMAHNQLIQDVFSKIQSVEARVVGRKQEQPSRDEED